MGKDSTFAPALDEKIQNLKKQLDIENSKYIFLLNGHMDMIISHKKKIQKGIEDISQTYYSEFLKKVKKKISKNQDIVSLEENVGAQIKTAILNEIM